MIYSNCFQILARSRNFLRPIIVLSQRTQRYATIPYLCVLFTLRKSSNFSAHRLSSFLPFSSTIQLFQLSDLLLRPIATQWTTRPTFDHRPSRTGHILSLARSYAAFSLSLSLSLSPSYTLRFVLPPHTHTNMLGYTQRRAAFLFSSIRFAAGAFFLISLVCTEIEFPRRSRRHCGRYWQRREKKTVLQLPTTTDD